MDLTQLEGFTPTQWELQVWGNPAFQELLKLRTLNIGQMITGFRINKTKIDYPASHEKDPMVERDPDFSLIAPNAVAKFADDHYQHLRSLWILMAKLAADKDRQKEDEWLLKDLKLWLDGDPFFSGFRWDGHQAHLESEAKEAARLARNKEYMKGESSLILLLLSQLTLIQRQEVEEALLQSCIERGLLPAEKRDIWVWEKRVYLPYPRCSVCDEPDDEQRRGCDRIHMLALLDGGDVADALRLVRRPLQRLIKTVRFKLPRSTYIDRAGQYGGGRLPTPELAIFGLDQLTKAERLEVKDRLCLWLPLAQEREKHEKRYTHSYDLWSNSKVILPPGRQALNAVLVAGWAATTDYRNWRDAFDDERGKELLKSRRLTVSTVSYR